MFEVSTSILNLEKEKENETILNLEKARTDYFHIDVMDGKFVKKDTYNKMMEIASHIKSLSLVPLDVHLMVENVHKAIEDFGALEPNIITFQVEACKEDAEVFEMTNLIKENNSRVGIAIKPETSVDRIYKFLPYIHVALVMTVEPGLGGQTFIPYTAEKIEILKKYIEENKLDTQIEVDGGINLETAFNVKSKGAEILVSGSAILMAKNYKNVIESLKQEV